MVGRYLVGLGGKRREIPVRHDLEGLILAYVEAAGIGGEAKESPLFRMSNGRTKKLSRTAMTSKRICELVKRRLKDAGLPSRLSPHSFRANVANRVMWRSVMVVRKFPKFGAACAT
jgi:integrase/recombinase XerD